MFESLTGQILFIVIYHIYRNTASPCFFKEVLLLTLCSNIGDNFYLSSGFFGEGSFSASNDYGLYCPYSICSNPYATNLHAKLIGCCDRKGLPQFKTFANNLKLAGYHTFCAYRPFQHAKVFLYQKGSTPIVEIIGSSNMTSRAFGSSSVYNHKADLIIINDNMLGKKFSNFIEANDNSLENFVTKIVDNNDEEILSDIKVF